MKKRKENINEVLTEFKNCDLDNEIFANFDYLSSYTLDMPFLREKLKNKYSVLQPPFPYNDKKYHFYKCKPPYQRNLAYYDQINYLEGQVKDNYFPREFIADMIEEDKKAPRLAKIRLNTMISKFQRDQNVQCIFAYLPYNIGILNVNYDSMDTELIDNTPIITRDKYRVSKKLTSNPIMQLSNAQNNQAIARTTSSYYRFKVLEDDNPDVIEVLSKFNFQWELYCTQTSPYIDSRTISLTDSNHLYIIDENKQEKLEMDISNLIESKVRNSDKHQMQLMDSFSHPDVFLLSNFLSIGLYDARSRNLKLVLSGKQKDELQYIYAIKHLSGQYFMTTTEKHLNIYDVRYPGTPYLSFMHCCDENPINVLGISEVYDPFNADLIQEPEQLMDMLETLHLEDGKDMSFERFVYGFSSLKKGSSLLFPNKIFQKFDITRDKYFEFEELDDYFNGLKSLEQRTQDFSFLNFKRYNHPKMLFSSNIVDEHYKTRGLQVIHFEDNIFTISNDSHNNLIFHSIKEVEESHYVFHNFIKSKDDQTAHFDEWTDFKKKINEKVFEKIKYEQLEKEILIPKELIQNFNKSEEPKISINISAQEIQVSQNLDDVDVELDEFKIPAKSDPYDAYDLSDLFNTLTSDDSNFEDIYKKVVKDRKCRIPTFADFKGNDVVTKAKLQQQLEDNGFDVYKPKNVNQIDDLKNGSKFVINQSIIDYLANKW